MAPERDLKERVTKFQEELLRRGAVKPSADLRGVQPSTRAYQLSQNYLDLMVEPIDLHQLRRFRQAVAALGERDLTDHRESKQPTDLPIIQQGYADEMELFGEHFPQSDFPSLYEP